MIDWQHKLTSRKFWLALIGFLTPLMLVFGFDELSTAQMETVVLSLGTLIAYILGESYIDGKQERKTEVKLTNTEVDEWE